MLMGVETSPGMDCLQLRQSAPFHYLISEQAKSLVALQELQHEVGALLEFRDLVIETFPNLRTKMASSSTPTTMTTAATHPSNIPVAVRRDWEPGVRVRRKLNTGKDERAKKAESAVQDSGFSTETSSKETHSSSTTAATAETVEDELWNLLDVIHRKGTRLRNEVEALQGAIRDRRDPPADAEPTFQRTLFHASSADDVRQLKRERDLLLDRVAEMEAEVLAGRVHTSRLQGDLEDLLAAKHDLEEQMRAMASQRGEINSRIQDLHLQFVAKSPERRPSRRDPSGRRTKVRGDGGDADGVPSDLPRVSAPDRGRFEAILRERDPLVLQRHLLTTTVENQVLQEKLETAAKKEVGLTDELDRTREENDDLKFQLEDKNIELEGTKARVRVLEQLQKPAAPSPDIIPASESPAPDRGMTRSEITTASMKAMSPFPPNLQLDHSSSTESAHDQAEARRRPSKPSKIPLKSYAAPKPPPPSSGNPSTGSHKSNNSNGHHHSNARSRSGDSLNRSHSAQSWRNKSEANSLSKGGKDSLGPSRKTAEPSSFVAGTRGTPRKASAAAVRRSGSVREPPDPKVLSSPRGRFRYQWILSSCSGDAGCFPDSLNETPAACPSFPWSLDGRFYDSIDSDSGSYPPDGDSLEPHKLFFHRSDTALDRK